MPWDNANSVIDLMLSIVMSSDGAAMNKALTDDGVHPNSAGYDIMEVKLLDTLSQMNQPNNQQ